MMIHTQMADKPSLHREMTSLNLKVQHYPDRVVVEDHRSTRIYKSPIDALIEEAKLFVGYVPPRGVRTGVLPTSLADDMAINHTVVSAIRRHASKTPQEWLLKIHVWSGMPLDVVEQLADVKAQVHLYTGKKMRFPL